MKLRHLGFSLGSVAAVTVPLVGAAATGSVPPMGQSVLASLRSTVGSGSWAAGVNFTSAQPTSVSCTSEDFCVATDSQGMAWVYSGDGWSSDQTGESGPNNRLTSVSCATTRFCMAVGQSGDAYQYLGNGQWTTGESVFRGQPLNVSCVTATFCIALTGSLVYSWNGKTWSQGADIDKDGSFPDLEAVSCRSPQFCLTVSDAGLGFSYESGKWATVPGKAYGSEAGRKYPSQLQSVPCPQANFCVATSDGGEANFYSGGHWTRSYFLNSADLESVSCATETFCVAVDQDLYHYTFNGQHWPQ